MSERTYQTFYRIVSTDPPTERDMFSQQALGRPLHSTKPDRQAVYDGVSVFDSEGQARAVALRWPKLGMFIAELHIPRGSPVRAEKTLGHGHYTLWGDPAILIGYVKRIVPVAPGSQEPEKVR